MLALVALAYGASAAWLHRSSASSSGAASSAPSSQEAQVMTHGMNGSSAMLSATGQKFVLEVRGMGIVVGDFADEEIWREIEKKADNHASYVSQNPEDYPDNDDRRLTEIRVSTGLSFREGARHAVEYWPIPVIVWGPPKDKRNAFRAASMIADARQQASLGVTLFLWQEDSNAGDGAAMIGKLFDFFDAHPDVPAALVFSSDGTTERSGMGGPGHGVRSPAGHIIPAMPDSFSAVLVSRSDRVDKLIRPFAVEQSASFNKTTTEYDVTKLWNFFWAKNGDRGPDSFDAQYQAHEKEAGVEYPLSPNIMSSAWWRAQLPELWKTLGNQGPGQFKPTSYIPVRWTTWQVKQFDDAPLLGYLHRPIDVKLTDDHGQPLKTALQATALKAGWEQAMAVLPDNKEPKRVFYDTSGDRQWVIPLNQALAQIGPTAPSPDNVKEGYDIGARIGDTGVSSPLVQIGLGLIASYDQGGASATINRRPNGTASIMVVSSPDDAAKSAWVRKTNGMSPFK